MGPLQSFWLSRLGGDQAACDASFGCLPQPAECSAIRTICLVIDVKGTHSWLLNFVVLLFYEVELLLFAFSCVSPFVRGIVALAATLMFSTLINPTKTKNGLLI